MQPTRWRFFAVLVVLGVFATALLTGADPASAQQAPTPVNQMERDRTIVKWTLVDTQYTTDGKMLSSQSYDITHVNSGNSGTLSQLPLMGKRVASGHTSPSEKSTTAGCATKSIVMERISLTHMSTLYRMRNSYSWCWYIVSVYNVKFSSDLENLAWGWHYNGILSYYNEYYAFRGFPKGGYRWYRKYQFQGYCLAWACETHNPWAKFWAHAGGTYYWEKSD